MSKKPTKNEILASIGRLPAHLQRKVLDFASSLQNRGVTGKECLKFQGGIPPEDLNKMAEAIEKDCERIDASGW